MEDQVIVRFEAFNEAVQKEQGRFDELMETKAAEAEPEDELERVRLVAAVTNAMGALAENDNGGTIMSSAQNGLASRLQSGLADAAAKEGKLREVRPAMEVLSGLDVVAMARLLEVRFDSKDWWGWVKTFAPLYLFKPTPAAWLLPPEVPEELPEKAALAVFSDWGTGLYGSTSITNQIKKLEACDVVFHLGDTYYAGLASEITSRLVNLWPLRNGGCRHRILNGNHEMYSGGAGYFNALKHAPFNQSSSCVAMQNSKWLLLGLDTSFIDAAIGDDQVGWIGRMIAAAGSRKVVLFSHHQIFSTFDKIPDGVRAALLPWLRDGRIHAWYFGHEHRLVVFEPCNTLGGVKARCMGHGGFPEFRQSLPGAAPSRSQWIQLPGVGDVPAAEIFDGPNRFIHDSPSDPEKYVPHGFLLLEFDADEMFETFLDPDGAPVRGKTRV